MIKRIYGNHTFSTLCLLLVIAMGAISYKTMPVTQDPTVNFNWIVVNTIYPGASPDDIEKSVTMPVEDAIRKLSNLRFVISTSRDSVSTTLLRFESMSKESYKDRMADLRRELQQVKRLLPEQVVEPAIIEVNSSNAFAAATLVVVGQSNDTTLRQEAKDIHDDLIRMTGVDNVRSTALQQTELQVQIRTDDLLAQGLNPSDIAHTVRASMEDLAAGSGRVFGHRWLIRWEGAIADPAYVAELPIVTAQGEVPLSSVADVRWGLEKPLELATYNGQPAVILAVLKEENKDVLKLIKRIEQYSNEKNPTLEPQGIHLVLLHDSREKTESAISIMETNAIYGLLLVLAATWLFLGPGMSLLISLGIPFSLAGAFWVLDLTGSTLNISVLLGVVIALGMLVDDAVVVMESIQFHMTRMKDPLSALVAALKETVAPVTTSVLTTLCAFLPLMLLPGILGDFMKVVPIMVTLALIISLAEAFWLLPSHVYSYYQKRGTMPSPSKDNWRNRFTSRIRHIYIKSLIKAFRAPRKALIRIGMLVLLTIILLASGAIKTDFFAGDSMRMIFVNVEMPAQSPIDETLGYTQTVEMLIRETLTDKDLKDLVSYSGMMITEKEVLQGEHVGQIMIALTANSKESTAVDVLVDRLRDALPSDRAAITFTTIADGPPKSAPIQISVRGDTFEEIDRAVLDLKGILYRIDSIHDVKDDSQRGQKVLRVVPDTSAIHRASLTPDWIMQNLHLIIDGQVSGSVNLYGEKLNVRVLGENSSAQSPQMFVDQTLFLPNGSVTNLNQMVQISEATTQSTIRHYNFKRAVTVTAELDKERIDTLTANSLVQSAWKKIQATHPTVDLVFAGELDDVQESLDAMPALFLLGIGLIYLVLGTQFRSYLQPILILSTIPMAFIGVVLGLFISRYPVSLYTLYGVVALSGIAVNSAIVLISAANERIKSGSSVLMATLMAARRRVIPIIITTTTTIAGLLSLALGLGGTSQMWGPVATAIVCGLFFSTLLTLYVLPLLFYLFMGGIEMNWKSSIKNIFPINETRGS